MTSCKDESIFSKLPKIEISSRQPCLEEKLTNLSFLSIENNMTKWLCEVERLCSKKCREKVSEVCQAVNQNIIFL